jgi:hypothetical protein
MLPTLHSRAISSKLASFLTEKALSASRRPVVAMISSPPQCVRHQRCQDACHPGQNISICEKFMNLQTINLHDINASPGIVRLHTTKMGK